MPKETVNNSILDTKIQHLLEVYENNQEIEEENKILETQKKQNANERCHLLYEKGKIKNEVNKLIFQKNSELKEQQELSLCTFKPKLNMKDRKFDNPLGRAEIDTYERNKTWKLRNNER